MKKISPLTRRGLATSLGVILISMLAIAPQTSAAFEFAANPVVNLCFGGINPYFADVVDSNVGNELIVTDVTEAVLQDSNSNGFVQVRSILKVRAMDRMGNELWESPRLTVLSRDVATFIDGQGFIPDSFVFPGILPESFASLFLIGGSPCYQNVFAVEADGEKYLAVAAGFVTQTGLDESSAVDQTRLTLWLLNRNTGEIEAEHPIQLRANRILSGFGLSGFGLVDDDADDELVLVYVKVSGGGKYRLFYETRNILTGVIEEEFDVFLNNIRKFP